MDQGGGVVLNNGRWRRRVKTVIVWSDYDSYFISNPFLEVVYLFHVKKYIHTRKYSLINFTTLQLTVLMHFSTP